MMGPTNPQSAKYGWDEVHVHDAVRSGGVGSWEPLGARP
jgi:hypothetical protein